MDQYYFININERRRNQTVCFIFSYVHCTKLNRWHTNIYFPKALSEQMRNVVLSAFRKRLHIVPHEDVWLSEFSIKINLQFGCETQRIVLKPLSRTVLKTYDYRYGPHHSLQNTQIQWTRTLLEQKYHFWKLTILAALHPDRTTKTSNVFFSRPSTQ